MIDCIHRNKFPYNLHRLRTARPGALIEAQRLIFILERVNFIRVRKSVVAGLNLGYFVDDLWW